MQLGKNVVIFLSPNEEEEGDDEAAKKNDEDVEKTTDICEV